MSQSKEAYRALLLHLEAEKESLRELLEALEAESDALRRMSVDDLGKVSGQKEEIVSRCAYLARSVVETITLIAGTGEIRTVSQLMELVSPEEAEELQILREEMLAVGEAIGQLLARTHAFASTGAELVRGLVKTSEEARSPSSVTYASDGQKQVGDRALRVQRRA